MNSSTWRTRLLTIGFALGLAGIPTALPAQDDAKSTDSNQPAAAQPAAAQDGQDRPRRGRGQGGGALNPVQTVERSREDVNALTLKDDQRTRLDAIFKEAAEQAKSLETEIQSMEPRERAQKVQPFNRELREKVAGVLDEQQRQTLRKNMATRQGKEMVDRWKRALGELNLTSEQQIKVDAVLADAQKRMETRAAEAGDGQGGGRGARGGGGNQETRQKIQEILTADQQQKLSEVMPQRGGGRGRRGNDGQ